ncbi:MAG TPA: adenylate/guanylate cyclase domain-containing protein [Anaerolineales bacterium]|nr:adenylate/guanylate cyclase domain-containing protein [Anaerolineales bacterium]
MAKPNIDESIIKNAWHTYLTTGNMPPSLHAPWFEHKSLRPIIKRLPKSPRCRICYLPFEGIGGYFTKTLLGVEASTLNPHLCNLCERFATQYHGGVEIEISIMFVDVRGSTTMAEKLSPEAFSKKINRFYRAATEVFYKNNGLVEKLLGDEVAGFFVPGFAGPKYARTAIHAGMETLKAMGYGGASGPWIPVGVGIHTGIANVGSVSADGGVSNISILGDAVNTAARLTALAAPGELLISEETRNAAGLEIENMESRCLSLKGKSKTVDAWALRI